MYSINKIVDIPLERVNTFNKSIEKFKKIASKLGIEPITVVTIAKDKNKKVKIGKESFLVKYNTYEVSGVAPVLNGWIVRARVDAGVHSENIIRSTIEVPERFRDNCTHCEHCNSNRKRNKLFLLEHTDNGEWKRVGSTCLKQFVAIDEVEKVISSYENIIQLLDDIDVVDEDYCRSSYVSLIDLVPFLKLVVDSTNQWGYINAKSAEETGKVSTAQDAITNLNSKSAGIQEYRERIMTNEYISKITTDVIEYFASKTPSNDYERVLKTIATDEFITYKELNYAASMYVSYKKANDLFEKKEEKCNEYLDVEIGKRYKNVKLNLLKIIPIESFYGMSYLHMFEDDDGRSVKWFGSSRLGEEGIYENLAFSVKSFDEYEGRKQTMITRVKS